MTQYGGFDSGFSSGFHILHDPIVYIVDVGGSLVLTGGLEKLTAYHLDVGGSLSMIGRIKGRNPLWIEIHPGERWLGIWGAGATYITGDVVLYTDGADIHAFKSKAGANTGNLPTDPAWWDRLVQGKWK